MSDNTISRPRPTRRDGGPLRVSFEFFPPRSEAAMESLDRVVGRLSETDPDFFSCTYGAGGSTRDGTRETVSRLLALGVDAAPHLSIGADTQGTIFDLLDRYRDMGVRRIVALRGDLPSGMGAGRVGHNAESLVRWIREHSGDYFHIEVAAYPEIHPDAASADSDLAFFAAKIRAGANSAITQYFYNPHAYYDFVDRCQAAGIVAPIYPGIMPITNLEGILRFSSKCGADVPRWLVKRLEGLDGDESAIRAFTTEYLTRMCEELIASGAPGLHFYTLNRWGVSRAICMNLGLVAAGT
ncbi:MAG TPA: methylenetetrahydrofolate reductase [NAD(P)H] [Pseudomonadales bacterium]